MKKVVKTDNSDYGRDLESKALVLQNRQALDKYLDAKKEKIKNRKLEEEVSSLRKDVEELKSLIKELKK